MAERYEAVIGLEVHCELKTKTKIFCSCPAAFGAEPNTSVCPICLGMPGTLPLLNEEAVRLGVTAGMAFGCTINRRSWFDRKNYFYPDLPKGYQITQYERPICTGGAVPIEVNGEKRKIGLTRIHLEEDAGKLIHRGGETLIDYNRCGVPLIEMVSEPEMHTPEEAKAYLNTLRRTLSYLGVSDCRMNEGSLRCDVNVSVRQVGETAFGTKVEIKNLNSVAYVGKALEDEIRRQTALLEAGEPVEPETRRYVEEVGRTERMRRKETAVDYRYFTEPNLPPLLLTEDYLAAVRDSMPKLPDDEADELCRTYGMKREDAVLLTETPARLRYFRSCAEATEAKTAAVNFFIGEVLTRPEPKPIEPEAFGVICTLFGEGRLVSGNAKKLIALTAEEGGDPRAIAERERLLKITDAGLIGAWVREAVSENPKAVADYRGGKTAAAKQLLGAVMRKSGGGADPATAERLLTEALESAEIE